ncbi:autotransporter-associated beta strand repeat-containing protein [Salmonella enterica]
MVKTGTGELTLSGDNTYLRCHHYFRRYAERLDHAGFVRQRRYRQQRRA